MRHPDEPITRQVFGLALIATLTALSLQAVTAEEPPSLSARIEVNPGAVTGTISPYFFGQFIEHEYNTIQGGLWAELLRDRKFEEGDADRDGVSDEWVPEERVEDRFWSLKGGSSPDVHYFVDQTEYFGGGRSQAIELTGTEPHKRSIYQIGLRLAKGRRYHFYVYLKAAGNGSGFAEMDRLGGMPFGRQDFGKITADWRKYETDFTATEDTAEGRLRIGFEGLGTFWMDSASLMPADNLHGMRRDVVEAMRPMRIPLMRYPGGCFADYYHWENGIGERDKRPDVFDDAWKEWDANDFGIDEFMFLAGELHFEPQLTTNYVSGTPEEAARWVEYLNGSPDTPMGKLRASNGHRDSYQVKFWAVGNEAPSLCSEQFTGGTKLAEYVSRSAEYKRSMESVDPTIRLMASSVGDLTWIHNLLQAMPVETLAISIYTGPWEVHRDDTRIYDLADYYRKVVAEPLEVDRKIADNIRSMGDRFPDKSRFFAVSEINSWWLSEKVDPDYRLANALYFAGVFHSLLRRADQIFTAEASTTINVQGLIGVNPISIKLTPPYFAYVLYANHIGNRVVESRVHGPVTDFNPELPSMDTAATVSADGRTLYIAVINRDEARPIWTDVRVRGWKIAGDSPIPAFELNGSGRDAANPYGNARDVSISQRSLKPHAGELTNSFPPHSVTVLEIPAER